MIGFEVFQEARVTVEQATAHPALDGHFEI
jgi:hypothetical protein